MPRRIPQRIVIYAKDVENITGRKPRTCRRYLQIIREHYKKKSDQPVTVREFCEFFKLEETLVSDFLES